MTRRGLRLVAGHARSHPGTFSLAILGTLLFALASVFSASVLGRVVDEVVLPELDAEPGTQPERMVLLLVILVAVVRSLGVVMRRYFAGMTTFRVRNDLQRALADQYLAMAPGDVASQPRGTLLAHVDAESDFAADAMSPLPFAVGVVTMLVAGFVSMLLVDVLLAAVVAGLFVAVMTVNHINTRVIAEPAVQVRHAGAAMTDVASESFDGAVVVKTLGRADQELARFSVAAAEVRDAQARLSALRAITASVIGALPELGGIVLIVIGAWRVGDGVLTPGDLTQAVALFGVLAFPIHVIGFFLSDLPPAVVAHDRITAALDLARQVSTGSAPLPEDGPLGVELADVAVVVDEQRLIDRISLDVEPGAVVALVGATGSGKSTVLASIAGLVQPSAGSVRIDGTELENISPEALARRSAMAYQEPFLLDASVAENIRFGLDLTDDEVTRAASVARFDHVALDLLDGYDTVVGERGVTLSGGQRQRLALARAIARRPGLLLLDDATSAIDPVVEEQILDGLVALGTTIVVVAHRRSTIAVADRVVLMEGGRVGAVGTHEQLLATNPAYQALLNAYVSDASELDDRRAP
jgi:ATP-binding cassette, subfamily B, bacterial